jgi:hypothetical protein
MVFVGLPEHWGVSFCLLSVTFAVVTSDLRLPIALALLALLTVLAAGMTITNGLFPAGAGVWLVWRRCGRLPLWFIGGAAAMALVATGIAATFVLTSDSRRENFTLRIRSCLNKRVTNDPLRAGIYAFRGLVDPIIGPTPVVEMNLSGEQMLTYESPDHFGLWPYDLLQSGGAMCWLILLCLSLGHVLGADRSLGMLLAGWIVFNLFFHNYWGDEFFLFSPHWCWALLAAVLVGARSLNWRWTLMLCGVLVVSQAYTLMRYHEMLSRITS